MSQAQAFLKEVADASVWALRWHRAQMLGTAQVVKVSAPGGYLGLHLGAVLVHFGSMLGFGGYLERPWGPCVPHLCGHTLKHVIVFPCGMLPSTLVQLLPSFAGTCFSSFMRSAGTCFRMAPPPTPHPKGPWGGP